MTYAPRLALAAGALLTAVFLITRDGLALPTAPHTESTESQSLGGLTLPEPDATLTPPTGQQGGLIEATGVLTPIETPADDTPAVEAAPEAPAPSSAEMTIGVSSIGLRTSELRDPSLRRGPSESSRSAVEEEPRTEREKEERRKDRRDEGRNDRLSGRR